MSCLERKAVSAGVSRAMVCGFLFVASVAQAGWNDCKLAVQISHAKAAPRDAKTALVSFDLEWDLSWRSRAKVVF